MERRKDTKAWGARQEVGSGGIWRRNRERESMDGKGCRNRGKVRIRRVWEKTGQAWRRVLEGGQIQEKGRGYGLPWWRRQ